MDKELLLKIEKDKMMEYIKLNSWYIKKLYRNPEYYERIKKEIKEKYNLRLRDKVVNVINDVELVTSIINTIS